MDWSANDTIIGLATAPGVGGIAILRLSGKQALAIAKSHFIPAAASEPFSPRSHQLYYGKIMDAQTHAVLDQGLFVYMQAPHSYTAEESVELHLHGGSYIAEFVQATLLKQPGLRLAEPGEFTFRAFLHQRLTLWEAEAVGELIQAQNQLAHRLALSRLQGDWRPAIAGIEKQLADLLSQVEARLDFPDDEHDFASTAKLEAELKPMLDVLASWCQAKRWQEQASHIPTVCLAGPTNVGKSTLFNALLKKPRALVSDEAGTTRDYLDAQIMIAGVSLRLVDTAGLRQGESLLEAAGIARSRQWLEKADVILWVSEPQNQAGGDLGPYNAEAVIVPVLNKADLLTADQQQQWLSSHPTGLCLSAKTGAGVEALQNHIVNHFRQQLTQVHSAAFCANQRQAVAIEQAHACLQSAMADLQAAAGDELLAEKLWQASRHLQELSGASLAPQVIEAIFRNFCIGK